MSPHALLRWVAWALATSLAVPALGAAARGEEASPKVEGRVVDRFARPVEGARVEVQGTPRVSTTSQVGAFAVAAQAGDRLLVTHPRFLPLEVGAADAGRQDLVLTQLEEISEDVVVRATPLGGRFSPNSVQSSFVEIGASGAAPRTLGEAARSAPGVSENGQGGLFQVLSIRGVSRQRVGVRLAGARITSSRRAGAAASFIDPLLLGEVEVVRGPASTYYGPGALGGALRLAPRRFSGRVVEISGGTEGSSNSQLLAGAVGGWSVGLARRSTSDGKTPSGVVLFDRFEQVSGSLLREFETHRARWNLAVLPSLGRDIGKPSSDVSERRTLYPREQHAVVRLAVEGVGRPWTGQIWAHPQLLETRVTEADGTGAQVDASSFDAGLRFRHELRLRGPLSGWLGVETFSRRGVTTRERAYDETGVTAAQSTLRRAEEDELGLFGVLTGTLRTSRWEAGARLTGHRQDDLGQTQEERVLATGFLGIAVPVTDALEVVGTLGRGVRTPSLEELFFTGSTGRGEIVASPDLREEESLNAEIGLRARLPRGYLQVQAYRNRVQDYIERFQVAPGTFTFRNLGRGVIEGLEVEAVVRASDRLRFDGVAQWAEGDGPGGAPLADVAPAEVKGAVSYSGERVEARLGLRYRESKDDAGPGEMRLASAWVADLGVLWTLTSGVSLQIAADNLFDKDYVPSADELALPARRRSARIGLRWSWP